MNKDKDNSRKNKQTWPTKDAMEQVYKMNLWGDNNSEFYSGEGSHSHLIVDPYVNKLRAFFNSLDNSLSVCDLGCGDFNVGKQLVQYTKRYIGVDIVADLISYNKKQFQEDNLEFRCLDIAIDEIPKVDCVLLRQVLQHLSNKEIQSIVAKLTEFKYVILTEHVPEEEFIPNKDIISGQGIRLKKKSGVNLSVAPFNFKAMEKKELLSIKLDKGKGIIITTLYKVF